MNQTKVTLSSFPVSPTSELVIDSAPPETDQELEGVLL